MKIHAQSLSRFYPFCWNKWA